MCPRCDGCSNSALLTGSCVTVTPSIQSQAVLQPSPKTAFVSQMRPNDTHKGREVYPLHHGGRLTDAAESESLVFAITLSSLDETAIRRPFLSPSDCSEDPDSWRPSARRARARSARLDPCAPGRRLAGPILFSCPLSRQRFSLLGSRIEPRKRGP